MTQELTTTGMMTYRTVLDYQLASLRGPCAIVGTECCTFIPDQNSTMQEIINHMKIVATTIRSQQPTGSFDWLKQPLGTLGYVIVEFVLLGLGCIITSSHFMKCIKTICKSSITTMPKIMYTTEHSAPERENSDSLSEISDFLPETSAKHPHVL